MYQIEIAYNFSGAGSKRASAKPYLSLIYELEHLVRYKKW